MMTKIQHS